MYRLVVIVALLALVVGVVLLSAPPRESVARAAANAPLHDPGYSATDARLVQTGADGHPVYTLNAAQIQQQPNNGLIELQQVHLTFRDSNGNEWTARALRGELAENSGLVKLDGDVHVAGTLPGSAEATEITSERLAFDTNAQVVTTREPVTITMSGRKLDAKGMMVSLKEGHVQLESAVHGSFRR
ncbi:MAG TPA: LPS export ABC transporter periplasmic protein LptC [Steroidobacteraceae bacterium]|nr:LPS export ABC transporter periplasmic protein LptC [Steroidobacteraceae bacterium]